MKSISVSFERSNSNEHRKDSRRSSSKGLSKQSKDIRRSVQPDVLNSWIDPNHIVHSGPALDNRSLMVDSHVQTFKPSPLAEMTHPRDINKSTNLRKSGPPTRSLSTSGSPRQDEGYPSFNQHGIERGLDDNVMSGTTYVEIHDHHPVVAKVPKKNKKSSKRRRSEKKPVVSEKLPGYRSLESGGYDSPVAAPVRGARPVGGGIVTPIEGGINGVRPMTYVASPRPPVPINAGSSTAVNAGRPIVSPLSSRGPSPRKLVSSPAGSLAGAVHFRQSHIHPYNMMKSPLSPNMLHERQQKAAMLGFVRVINTEDKDSSRPSSSSSLLSKHKERALDSSFDRADPHALTDPHKAPSSTYTMPRTKKSRRKVKKTLSISDHVEVIDSPKRQSSVIQDHQLYSPVIAVGSPGKHSANTCCGPPAPPSPIGTIMIQVSSSSSATSNRAGDPHHRADAQSTPMTPFNYKSKRDVLLVKQQWTESSTSPETPVFYKTELDKVRNRKREEEERKRKLAEKEARRKQEKRRRSCGGFCGFCKEDARLIEDIPARKTRKVKCTDKCCGPSAYDSYRQYSLTSSHSKFSSSSSSSSSISSSSSSSRYHKFKNVKKTQKKKKCSCGGCCDCCKKEISSKSSSIHYTSPISELTTRLEPHEAEVEVRMSPTAKVRVTTKPTKRAKRDVRNIY